MPGQLQKSTLATFSETNNYVVLLLAGSSNVKVNRSFKYSQTTGNNLFNFFVQRSEANTIERGQVHKEQLAKRTTVSIYCHISKQVSVCNVDGNNVNVTCNQQTVANRFRRQSGPIKACLPYINIAKQIKEAMLSSNAI